MFFRCVYAAMSIKSCCSFLVLEELFFPRCARSYLGSILGESFLPPPSPLPLRCVLICFFSLPLVIIPPAPPPSPRPAVVVLAELLS